MFYSKTKFLKNALPTALIFLLAACSSGPRVHEGTPGSQTQSGSDASTSLQGAGASEQQYGPPTVDEPKVSYGPEPVSLKPLTLVFGSGMARSFAQVGVLRALEQNKIPIGAVYGTELGGLIAALYALDSNINHFEWNLEKFKEDLFITSPGLMGTLFNHSTENSGDPSKLEEALKETFLRKDISETKMPLFVELQKKGSSSPEVLKNGNLTQILRSAVAVPGLFSAGALNGKTALAASGRVAVTYLCVTARAQNGSPIILIDTAPNASDPSAADLVIRPDLSGVGLFDFSKRNEIALKGKTATEALIPELRKWAGLPVDSSDVGAKTQ